jgi:hypothetical protein
MADLNDISPERWQRVKAILSEALELPLAARDAFVGQSCRSDLVFRSQVGQLLALSAEDGMTDLLSSMHPGPTLEESLPEGTGFLGPLRG